YRAGCLALLIGNLALLYSFCLRLAGSREIAALACLLGAYHAHLADIYYSTATVYDLLCGVFYLSAFLYYARARDRGRLRWSQMPIFLALYLCAINAKEMALTLPLIVLLYDMLYDPPQPKWPAALLWLKREARRVGPSVLLTAAFIVYKTAGPRRMLDNPD